MKQYARQFLPILLLVSAAGAFAASESGCNDCFSPCGFTESGCFADCERDCDSCNDQACGTSQFLPRPQGMYQDAINYPWFSPFYYDNLEMSDTCFNFFLGYRYRQSFKGQRIAQCLFGSDVLTFSGSKAGVFDNELLADNFGLAPNFRGRLTLNPVIKDHMVDFGMRWELGNYWDCLECAWFAFNGTAVHSTWDLRACECSEAFTGNKKLSDFPACYMSKNEANATRSISTALSGEYLFGDMQSQWNWGRFDLFNRDNSITALANVDLWLGYDFLRCDTYHVGAFLKGVMPTGNRPDAGRVFQPIAGNGHHFELGGGLDAAAELWSCDDHSITAWLTGYATHMFKDTQWRSFDFCGTDNDGFCGNGCLSRYSLLKEFDNDGEYIGNLINAINFNTRQIKSSFGVQGEASLRLLYRNECWAVGLGYNVWGRSQEKLECVEDCCNELRGRNFGIKGVNGVCARAWKKGFGPVCEECPPYCGDERRSEDHGRDGHGKAHVPCEKAKTKYLHSTASQARAYNCMNEFDLVDPIATELNGGKHRESYLNWDSEAPCFGEEGVIYAKDSLKENGEPNPVFVDAGSLNYKETPSALSHSVFATVDYQWEDCECQPWFGVGGSAEFAQKGDCRVCTANFWQVWVHGGISF